MEDDLIGMGYIPLDKSWVIRIGVLDILRGSDATVDFLRNWLDQGKRASDDLHALVNATMDWKAGNAVRVGESGALYRFLQFAAWKLGLEYQFLREGTLAKRDICQDPDIIHYPLAKLLTLDNKTSQWASAAVLLGNRETVEQPPSKLAMTYETVGAYPGIERERYDFTILRQAQAYLEFLRTGEMSFVPEHQEDYCFSRAFEIITQVDVDRGRVLERWPSLEGHETKRVDEMERALRRNNSGLTVDSLDHRVVQALAKLQYAQGKDIQVKFPMVANKCWPEFWDYMSYVDKVITSHRNR